MKMENKNEMKIKIIITITTKQRIFPGLVRAITPKYKQSTSAHGHTSWHIVFYRGFNLGTPAINLIDDTYYY